MELNVDFLRTVSSFAVNVDFLLLMVSSSLHLIHVLFVLFVLKV